MTGITSINPVEIATSMKDHALAEWDRRGMTTYGGTAFRSYCRARLEQSLSVLMFEAFVLEQAMRGDGR